ncbi:glycerate kinase, partial [Acinetobacter soli]|uniref:glycerate kinase n=1 Tax=Acinetobacter soli TaxID=487316 RepID=UPI0020912015
MMKTKTFVLAPDSFKESMTAREACLAMQHGLQRISSALATQVLRVSGLNALTSASKVGFTKMLMNKYGTLSRTK